MFRILIADGMEKTALNKLKDMGLQVIENHFEPDELKNTIKEFDVLVIRSATKVEKPIIDAACETGKLKLIVRCGVGMDNIDKDYAESKGIMVRNTPDASCISVAELVVGHMFNLARFIHNSNITMRQGKWNKKAYEGIEIFGKTIGVIGFGRIGRETAKLAKALGMKVVYNDIAGPVKGFDEYQYVSMDSLLRTSDFITLHIPYSGERAVIGREEISKMKDGAYIINCARGGVVDEEALIEALDSNKLAGAAMDVFREEPARHNPLCKHDKVSLTPHLGASTVEAQMRAGEEIVSIITDFCIGVS